MPRIILEKKWISKHMPNGVWDAITNPFPNFSGCTAEVWEISNSIPHLIKKIANNVWKVIASLCGIFIYAGQLDEPRSIHGSTCDRNEIVQYYLCHYFVYRKYKYLV